MPEDIAVFNEIPESLRIILHEELYRDFFRDAHIFSGFDVPRMALLFASLAIEPTGSTQELEESPQIVKRVCHFCFQETVPWPHDASR